MGGIFSKGKKKSRVTEVDKQVLTLKLQRDQLLIFKRKLEHQYSLAEETAKEYESFRIFRIHARLLRQEKKSLALLALKRRKQQDVLIHQTEEHLIQVNQLISNVEMASMQAEVVKAVEAGNTALKSLQSEVSLDYVSKLMDTNAELQSEVREISDLLHSAQAEDPSVVAEFERLQAEVAADLASNIPAAPSTVLPLVDSSSPLSQRSDLSVPAEALIQ